MTIDFNAIITAKLEALSEAGTIETTIGNAVEKLITDAVKSAFGDWKLKSEIEKKITAEISDMVNTIGLEGYRDFILRQTHEVVNAVCREDIRERANKFIHDVYFHKFENIKLTDIIQAYKTWLESELSDEDKHSIEHFELELDEESHYNWLKVKMFVGKKSGYTYRSNEKELSFTLSRTGQPEKTGTILSTTWEGNHFTEGKGFRYLNDMEAMLLSIYFNKTPIIIDITNPDDFDTCIYHEG